MTTSTPGALRPGTTLDALALTPLPVPVPAGQVLDGTPTTAVHELGTVGGAELGVWELTAGTSRDVETDEVFVVLAGRAEVLVEGVDAPMVLVPGTVGRLSAGMRTVWTVTETLRKVYVLGA